MTYGRLTLTGNFNIVNAFDETYAYSDIIGTEVMLGDQITFEELPEPINLQDGQIFLDTKTRSALYKRVNGGWKCCGTDTLNWVEASVDDKVITTWLKKDLVKPL